MCTRYVSPESAAIERAWHLGRHTPWQGGEIFPQRPGAFIRAARDSTGPERELVVGQWGLVPWFAKSPKLSYATCNARSEEMADKATFKDSWRHGRRCIIPAQSFDEPNWESGRNVWWRFRRVDGAPWGLAGLWNTWVDRATGEVVESYTMLTVNADHHPLMRRMHKPDPKLPPDAQDKRAVIPVQAEDVDLWLHGRSEDVRSLLRLDERQAFDAGPAELDSSR